MRKMCERIIQDAVGEQSVGLRIVGGGNSRNPRLF